jgi:hypothetical protein
MLHRKAKVYYSPMLIRKPKVYSVLHAYAFWITVPLFALIAIIIWLFAPVA